MTLLATVQALLHRYTGQEDIVTGSPIAGRDHADLENLVGLFLNNISIRCRFRGEDRFTDLLAQVKQKCLSAYEHQLYPFDLLTGDLNLKRDISRSPLFDVVVVLQNAQLNSDGEKEMENVATTKFDSGFRVSTIDIRIVFTEHDNGISCLIDYNTDIYKEETITAFFNNLSLLINAIMENEAIRIYDFRPAGVKAPAPVQALSTAFNF
jgi:non-ribosomal peptide synthetase component F